MDSIINWLTLPEDQRPGLIMVYYHEPDGQGHHFGPNSKEVENTVENIDQTTHLTFSLK